MMMIRKEKSESGQATVFLIVFLAIVMLGFLGLSLDVGYFFHEKRMAQAAADAAAIAAAEEDGYGDSSNSQAAAATAAKLNGFDNSLAVNPATVGPPAQLTAGNYSNSGGAVAPTTWIQVTVSKPIPGFFLSAFLHGSSFMTVSATSVAGEGQVSPTCVCLEGTSGEDLNMSNNAKLTASGCGVTDDSSSSNAVGVVGSANITAQSLGTISTTWDNSSNINNGGSISSSTRVVTGISTQCAPSLPATPNDTSCSADPFSTETNGGASFTVGPNSSFGATQGGSTVCYTALTVGANGDTVTLNAGTYVINGGELHFESGGNKGGTGVTFYLENGASLVIDNGANINLVAPTTGTYSGVLVYQAANDTQPLSVQGGSSAVFNGAIYAPGAALTLGNGSGSSFTADVVAQSLTMNGGGTLTSNASANLGTLNISVSKISE